MKKLLSILSIILITSKSLWAQCAMCKASAETSMESSTQAAGVNAGVLYVLFFVAVALSFFIYIFYKGNQINQSK